MLNVVQTPTPVPYYDPAAFGQQRPYAEPVVPIGRSIVPRPQGMHHAAYAPSTSPYSQSPSVAEPPRKRGRPSNADLERRRQAAEARGETYVPQPTRPRKPKTRVSATPSEIAAGGPADTPRRDSNTDPLATPPSLAAPVTLTRTTTSPALSHMSHSSKRMRSPEAETQEGRLSRREGDDVPRSMDPNRSRGPHWPSAAHPSPWSQPSRRPPSPPDNNSLSRTQPGPLPPHMDSTLINPVPVPQQARGETTRSPLHDGERWRK